MTYISNVRLNNLLAQHINEFKEAGHYPTHCCFSDLVKVYKFVESCLTDGVPNGASSNYVAMSQETKEGISGLQATDYQDYQEHIISLVDAILFDKEGFPLQSFRDVLIDSLFQYSKEYAEASDSKMTFRLSNKDIDQSKLDLECKVKDTIASQLDR